MWSVAQAFMTRSLLATAFSLQTLLASACVRERVEVAESESEAGSASKNDSSDAEAPFAIGDASSPGTPTSQCGPPPIVNRCAPCPSGFLISDDGGTTCDCCP